MATDRRAYMRAWQQKHHARRLVQRRAWYAATKEQRRAYRKERGPDPYRDRAAYMRDWWAKLKAADPTRREAYSLRSNRRRAIASLPPDIHEMRLTLFEFRRAVRGIES